MENRKNTILSCEFLRRIRHDYIPFITALLSMTY